MARKSKVLSKTKSSASKGSKRKAKDFTKVKNKVGKSKKAPLNETKTDFKVKKVQLPSQSALDEKGEEVTHRRLGLAELLAHLQHHSPKVRRDALRGLLELCKEHDSVLQVHLSRVLDSLAMVATDGSMDVRASFRSFQAYMLEALPQDAIAAFSTNLALQVRSALSHVSAEVREDGLKLLELYLSRLGSEQVLSHNEASRVVGTLCQLHSHVDLVLPCLLQLQPCFKRSGTAKDGVLEPGRAIAQVSMQDVLEGKLRGQQPGLEGAQAGQAQLDSQIWDFCLRAWMQAGDLPRGSTKAGRGQLEVLSRPGWICLRVVAVLERTLEGLVAGSTSSMSASSQPSAAQVASLSGLVRREEWPMRVDAQSPFRQLADSINLRMARVMALLACGAAPADTAPKHLQRLAQAALAVVEDLALTAARSFAQSARGAESGGADAAAAAVTAIGLAAGEEVKPFSVTGTLSHSLQVLDHLWSCVGSSIVPGQDPSTSLLAAEDRRRLVEVTSCMAAGTGEAGEEVVATPASLLSVPLTASLLGLRPSTSPDIPAGLRRTWPEVLLQQGEVCLADFAEEAKPNACLQWASAWPKLLWYIGAADARLSSFLLVLIIELSKLATKPGGLHERILAPVLPLLVPFLAGMPGSRERPPPLALLSAPGPQQLAASVLPHFPRLKPPLLAVLADVVCRWSEAARDSAEMPHLSQECSEQLLEGCLRGRAAQREELLVPRLRAAMAVLKVVPHRKPSSDTGASRCEQCALRLASVIAAWVMEDLCEASFSEDAALFKPVSAYSYDERRRLAFQSLAWPIALQMCTASLAGRGLSFFFFCAARLPQASGASTASAGCHFLREIFDVLVVRHGAAAITPNALSLPQHPMVGRSAQAAELFVIAWMRVSIVPREWCYELLVKLCTQHLLELTAKNSTMLQGGSSIPTALVLVQAIQYRNAHSLRTTDWGQLEIGNVVDKRLAGGPDEIRTLLEQVFSELCSSTSEAGAAANDQIAAALPLL